MLLAVGLGFYRIGFLLDLSGFLFDSFLVHLCFQPWRLIWGFCLFGCFFIILFMKAIVPTDYLSPSSAETNAGNYGTNNYYFTGTSLEFPFWLQVVSDLVAKQNHLSFCTNRMDQKISLFLRSQLLLR